MAWRQSGWEGVGDTSIPTVRLRLLLVTILPIRFQTGLRSLFREPMRVDTIYVSGLVMNIPPKKDRQQIKDLRQGRGKMSIFVDRFVCADTKLVINTDTPGKLPLEFDIGDLRIKDIGPSQPLRATCLSVDRDRTRCRLQPRAR